MRNSHVLILAAALAIISVTTVYVKHRQLGLPLTPDQEAAVWTVEARIEADGTKGGVTASLAIPKDTGDYVVIDEYFISGRYGTSVERSGDRRVAEWSVRRADGPQRLFYQVELVSSSTAQGQNPGGEAPNPPSRPDYPEPLKTAVMGLLEQVRSESADVFTFVSQLLARFNDQSPDADIRVIGKGLTAGSAEWVERVIYVLAGARIPARLVRGLSLESGKTDQPLTPWLEVHNGSRWEGFDPLSGRKGYPPNFVRWVVGSEPLLTATGVRNARVLFSVSEQPQALTEIAHQRASAAGSALTAWSLFKLPLNTQQVYGVLLVVPLGALVVVFMRTVIGIPTYGTFMPILIALAFRETGLGWGIALFGLIVAAGLSLRLYLNHLRLLMVPRLSAMLTAVVILILGINLISNQLGIVQGFSVALFPIVILTMVIERMSIVWDESGPGEALKEALGSMLVGALGYQVMNVVLLQHLIFVFPELLLLVLALCLLFGTYTGYRLSELLRFRDLANVPERGNAGRT